MFLLPIRQGLCGPAGRFSPCPAIGARRRLKPNRRASASVGICNSVKGIWEKSFLAAPQIVRHGIGAAVAVEGGGDYTAGVACPFARREQSLYLHVHERVGIARNTHGSGGPRFDAYHDGFGCQESLHPSAEIGYSGPKRLRDEFRHPAPHLG